VDRTVVSEVSEEPQPMPMPDNHPMDNDPSWWRQAVVYQIYPRSFADGNGDGLGDFAGALSRVDYLRDLGIDAVWLSPFYPSALADGGYDVDDYRNVDPRIGTLADFDALTAALHHAGLRVIVDIVPNHTSNRHVWFQEALASPPGSPARERYIFRDGVAGGPPSDWQSHFGGSAWQQVPDGQYYLHFFAPEQPDLNWSNPEVHEDFLTTLRFWSDRGADGFRVDVANMLAKDMTEPLLTHAQLFAKGFEDVGPSGHHPTVDRDEVHQIYREWRKVFNEYDPPRTGIAEAWVPAGRRALYASPEGLGQAFNFDLLRADWDAGAFRTIIDDNLRLAESAGSSSTWVLSNHDVVRHATRYGLPNGTDFSAWLMADGLRPAPDLDRGLRRARAAVLLLLALPGSTYLYQGEELGLPEVADLPAAVLQDPTWLRSGHTVKGRDGCRVPLPWTATGPSYGFGAGGAHLPQPAWFSGYSVETELAEPTSTLHLYRDALAVRRRLQGAETLRWLESADADVLIFQRPSGWTCVSNFGETPIDLPAGEVVCASALSGRRLPGDATAWLLAD
jgi:alpha-glucosidase